MKDIIKEGRLNPWEPAFYRIEVEGLLEARWSDRFAGMEIHSRQRADQSVITTLSGRLMDQCELTGVLNGLVEMHLSILKVENCGESY